MPARILAFPAGDYYREENARIDAAIAAEEADREATALARQIALELECDRAEWVWDVDRDEWHV